jgi:hypothetical protein
VPDQGVLLRQLQGALRWGTGSPEGVVDAPKGVLYQRRDGSTGTLLYIKTTGLGTLTGWVAIH